MKYEAVIFDVSDTLIEYSPNYAKIYGDRLRFLGYNISEETAKQISCVINWTIGEQTRKEQDGEAPISDEELNQLLDEAALSCVTDISTYNKKYLAELSKLPIPKQEMKVISGVFEVLNVLKTKYRLAIVSNHYS